LNPIPLLSPKAFSDLTPAEFKQLVLSLYFKPSPKKSAKKEVKPFTFRLNAKGTVCIRVNRTPKWLSSEEVDGIAVALKVPASEVWIKVSAKKSGIVISTEERQATIRKELASIPW
jgi:biotin synthase-related radical SAM superfamily protein